MRRATIRTVHDDPATVAAAVSPDNTAEMTTNVVMDDGAPVAVETTIRRETTGGLRATVDDYVTNLRVAQQVTTDRHEPKS